MIIYRDSHFYPLPPSPKPHPPPVLWPTEKHQNRKNIVCVQGKTHVGQAEAKDLPPVPPTHIDTPTPPTTTTTTKESYLTDEQSTIQPTPQESLATVISTSPIRRHRRILQSNSSLIRRSSTSPTPLLKNPILHGPR